MPEGEDYVDDEPKTLAERFRSLKERVKRKKTAAKAERRASARRVEMEEPETTSEKVAVKKRRLSEAADEASELVGETKETAAITFGLDDDDGSMESDNEDGLFSGVVDAVSDAAENAAEADFSEPLGEEPEMEPLDTGGLGVDAGSPGDVDPVEEPMVDDPMMDDDDDLDEFDPF